MKRMRQPVAAAALLIVLAGLQQSDLSGQTVNVKLTTVLADLARAVPQDEGAAPSPRATTASVSAESMPASVGDAMHGRRVRINSSNEVQVYVLMQAVTDDTLRQLTASGATIEISDVAHRRVQARVPVTRLQAVSALPFVNFVKLPTYAVRHTGAALTEGDAIMHADAVRRQFSLDGTGVRVGVISDGLKGVFATGCTSCSGVAGGPIATGDLPDASGTRTASGVLTASTGGIAGRSFQANGDLEGLPPASPVCAFAGAGAEGTALLEIVHDLAPGARLAFANADTDLAFNQAVNFLASTNDVVVDDLGFLGEAYDGTSPVSSNTAGALNNGANPIRTYVTAVGNDADEHYIGTYADSGVDGSSISGVTGGHLHLFQQSSDTTDVLGLGAHPYNVISMPAGGEVVAFLTWDDKFGASSNNYDLYLVRESTNAVVAKSTDLQSGTQDPVEAIDYINTGAAGRFHFVVQNVQNRAAAKQLNLFSFEPECAASGPLLLAANHHERHNYNTATRSVSAEGDAGGSPVSVISVGGICSASAAASAVFAGSAAPDESCNDRTNSTIEFFSSQGPTIDGRQKPDVSGIDGVSITGAGRFENPFFGTSAAAPHVAGLAALTLQSAPCLIAGSSGALDPVVARTTLRNLIVGNAVSLDSSGPDNVFGSGRADAFASVQKTLPVFKGPASLAASGNTPLGATLTAAQLGFTDPNQCALTRLSWSGGCGTSPGSTLNCPFGTTKVSVSASNNGVSFSGSSDVEITVTNFALATDPASATVTAGQAAVYQVTISPQGGAFASPITLACANLPVNAACAFSPSTVAPGAGAVQSTLTITTASRSAIAPARLHAQTVSALAVPALLVMAVCLCRRGPQRRAASRRALAGLATLTVAIVTLQVACSSSAPPSTSTPSPTPTPTPAPSAAAVTLSPTSVTFTSQSVQTTSAPQTVTLTNSGNAALSVTSITTAGDFAQTNTCGSSIAAGASCAIAVTFTPTATGQRTGTLTITDSAANSPQTVTLTGTATAGTGGTPAGTYQVSVTGASGSLTQAGTVTLVVR